MKFCLVASIAIFFSWFTLLTTASNKNEINNTLIDLSKNVLHNNVLGLIINQLLTIQDILILRATCHLFENLLQPIEGGMVTFCNYAEHKRIIDVDLYWINLAYFLNESYGDTLHEMKLFTIHEDKYAILTRGYDQKSISWFKTNLENSIDSEPIVKVYTKNKKSFVEFIKGGPVVNLGGDQKFVKEIPDDLLEKMEKIKTIISSSNAFAALLYDGNVFAWGDKETGGLIPDEIQTQLTNIKKIYSNHESFVAVSKNGKAYEWGSPYHEETIPVDIAEGNVKMIVSTTGAFAALLNDGSVRAWGSWLGGGVIPGDCKSKLKKVKMLFSNDDAFTALLPNGIYVSWGYERSQKSLQNLITTFYNNGEVKRGKK